MKSEARIPKSERNPNSEARRGAKDHLKHERWGSRQLTQSRKEAKTQGRWRSEPEPRQMNEVHGPEEGQFTRRPLRLRASAVFALKHRGQFQVGPFRVSEFGFLSDFGIRNSGFASHLPALDQLGKPLETAVIGAFDGFGETAGRKLPQAQVILETFAANPVLGASRIAAVAEGGVLCCLAVHGLRLTWAARAGCASLPGPSRPAWPRGHRIPSQPSTA